MDSVKYDRQIRLFGEKTQEKLCSTTVQILGSSNLISAEIIKNVVLLGVGKIIIYKSMLNEVSKIVPDSLQSINPNLVIEFSNNPFECDFRFNIDYSTDLKGFHICSNCLLISSEKNEHECIPTNDELLEVRQCLVGAFSVQEFIKFTQGKESIKNYKINF